MGNLQIACRFFVFHKLVKLFSKNAKHFKIASDINTVRKFKRIWTLAKNKKTLHGGNTK